MKTQDQIVIILFTIVFATFNPKGLFADDYEIATVIVNEPYGLSRSLEYVEFSCQVDKEVMKNSKTSFYAYDVKTNEEIECQSITERSDNTNDKLIVRIIFPVSMKPFEEKQYLINKRISKESLESDLKLIGEGTELIVDNDYYSADLRKNDAVEGHSHMSGQIRELKIKMGFNQLLTNVEDRLHWAPNFKRPELEHYITIAHWDMPKINVINSGQYQITTLREDLAPSHPEILLTARYRFYAGLPYFRFFSRMEMKNDIWLELLRNDEMAMDSMFTHMAFQRPNGEIVDVEFSQRYELLSEQPIENNSPWLCFYNQEEGFAFGSIRINYDNTNNSGSDSPTYKPHTQIGEWLKGIKYWNRRLVHDHLTFIPKGSCYKEDNAYLVFKINKNDKLKDIRYWVERIRSPLQVTVEYLE